MRTLEVTIKGGIGEGKSTLALIIIEALRRHNATAAFVGDPALIKFETRLASDRRPPQPGDLDPFHVTIATEDPQPPRQVGDFVYDNAQGKRVFRNR